MGRLLAIDYGRRRCGVAVTDPLKICANGLPTVPTHLILQFIKDFCDREEVEGFVVGEPLDLKGNPSENMKYVTGFVNVLKKNYPAIPVFMVDERFTSTISHREMIAGGFKKKDRKEKGRADEMSAVLILTTYLESKAIGNK